MSSLVHFLRIHVTWYEDVSKMKNVPICDNETREENLNTGLQHICLICKEVYTDPRHEKRFRAPDTKNGSTKLAATMKACSCSKIDSC
jgi:hypothetical protein